MDFRKRLATAGAVALGMLILGGCAAPAPQAAGDQEAAKPLPVVDLSGGPAFPLPAHLESEAIASGSYTFEQLFEDGAKLFHTPYNGLDGVGGFRLPDGATIPRFSVIPPGHGALAAISSQSCGGCHNMPHDAAAGIAQTDIAFDIQQDGTPPFNTRATTSLFGNGWDQLVAQEITEDLQTIRDGAAEEARAEPGTPATRKLESKGIDYGAITATADGDGEVAFDLSAVAGVDPDLVVRPFGSKGNLTTIRGNTVGPAAALMGMQPEELVMKTPAKDPLADADGDGVGRELSAGDLTALVVYGAAQETPQPVQRLATLGLVQPPDAQTVAVIEKGEELFAQVGCTGCHISEVKVRDTVFEEPTARGNGHYYDHLLAEKDSGYDPERPFRFDLLAVAQPPRAEADPDGGATLHLYGDFKRHHMGRQLADPGGPQPPITADFAPLFQDGEIVLIAPDEFLTPELWGVGNTGPWLHDARAGTLDEAILLHGEDDPPAVGEPGRSEAQEARDAYAALPEADRTALTTFLRSLRTFSANDPGER